MTATFHAPIVSMRNDISTRASQPHAASTSVGDDGDSGDESNFWGEDGFTFGDILDVLNPLQHIPIVSTIYRAVTGDEVSTGARVFGSALLGGALLGSVIGLFGTIVDSIVKETSGKAIGEHALALFDGSPTGPQDPAPVQVAAAELPVATALAREAGTETDAGGDAGDDIGGEVGGEVNDAATPVWLARMPKARADYSEMVARIGAQTTTDALLQAMSRGLDKYDQMQSALDLYERRKNEPTSDNLGIDTVL